MDPDRVKAYLQVACTGLGFDIGEIWWSSENNGSSSALMAIGRYRSFPFRPMSRVGRHLRGVFAFLLGYDWVFHVFITVFVSQFSASTQICVAVSSTR